MLPDIFIAMNTVHSGSTWAEAHALLDRDGAFMLPPWIFLNFLKLLQTGNVYDAMGSELASTTIRDIYTEITARGMTREEWLDAHFTEEDGTLNMASVHRMNNGIPRPQNCQPLDGCLMQDSVPPNGIDLVSLTKNATLQGLPSKKVSRGETAWTYPRLDTVLRFGADHAKTGFYCGKHPGYSNDCIAVRPARISLRETVGEARVDPTLLAIGGRQ